MEDPIVAHHKRMTDLGFQHEKAAVMKLYAMQAKYVPLHQEGPGYLTRLMNNQVSQIPMKPGGKVTDFYSNKRSSTLDNKLLDIKSSYKSTTTPSSGYKFNPQPFTYGGNSSKYSLISNTKSINQLDDLEYAPIGYK